MYIVHKVKVKINAVATLTLCTIYKGQWLWKNMGKFADAFTQNSWQALISDTYSFTTIVSEYPRSILKAYLLSRTGNGREQTCRPLPEPRRAPHLFPSARGFAPLSAKQMQILPPCRFRAFFDSTYLDNSSSFARFQNNSVKLLFCGVMPENPLKNAYFVRICKVLCVKKDPAKLLLQGQFYNFVCLLCQKA